MSDTFDHEGDAWDAAFAGELDDEENFRVGKYTACRRCGSTSVHWRRLKEGWRLHDSSGALHICNQVTPGWVEAFKEKMK